MNQVPITTIDLNEALYLSEKTTERPLLIVDDSTGTPQQILPVFSSLELLNRFADGANVTLDTHDVRQVGSGASMLEACTRQNIRVAYNPSYGDGMLRYYEIRPLPTEPSKTSN